MKKIKRLLGNFHEEKRGKFTLFKISTLLLAIIFINIFLTSSPSIAKKKFGKTLPISINISSKWDYQPGNYRIIGNYKATVAGMANLIEEKGEFLRYSLENLTVSYEFKEDHIETNRHNPCFRKIVEQNYGSGNAKLINSFIDVFLGKTGKATWVFSQGRAPTPEELKTPKDVYSVFMAAEGKYTMKTKTDVGCDLKYYASSVLPIGFVIGIAEMKSEIMTGNYAWQGDRDYKDEKVVLKVIVPSPDPPGTNPHYQVSWTIGK